MVNYYKKIRCEKGKHGLYIEKINTKKINFTKKLENFTVNIL